MLGIELLKYSGRDFNLLEKEWLFTDTMEL